MVSPLEASFTSVIDELPSPESRRAYTNDWAAFTAWLASAHSDVPVLETKPKHILGYVAHMRGEGKARSTIGRALSVIRAVYGAFVRDELMDSNPAREVKNPKQTGAPKTPWLTQEEASRLFGLPADTWRQKRDRMGVLLLFGLGWRRAEVARMRLADFERRPGKPVTVTGTVKGGKDLTVGVPPWLVAELEAWVQFAGIKPRGAILPRSETDARPVSGSILYNLVTEYAKAAAVKINPHGLRRTNITLMGELGVSLKDRQLAVGHASQTTTERYDRARDAAAKAPGQVLGRLVKKSVDPDGETV